MDYWSTWLVTLLNFGGISMERGLEGKAVKSSKT